MNTLEFKWTVSRGRDTYGYNICSLYLDSRKVASCNGGGYDMKGTSLGNFIARAYADRLRALTPEEMPANSHWEPAYTRICDGECFKKYEHALMDAIERGETEEQTDALRAASLLSLPRDCFTCPTCGGDTRPSRDGKTINDGRYFYGLTYHDPNFDPSKAVIGKGCTDRTLTKPGETSEGKTVEQAEAEGVSFGLERYQAFYCASSKIPTERHTVPLIDGACGFSSVEKIMAAVGLTLEWVNTRSRKQDIYILHDSRKEGKQ